MDGKLIKRREFIKTGSLLTLSIPVLSGKSLQEDHKRITLIGDSIRLGYQDYVPLYLNDPVEIWGPDDPRINTINILQEADSWIRDRTANVIHINSGLEDLKRISFSSRKNLIPLGLYRENIERIIKYIHRVHPDTLILWATTTPVDDEKIISVRRETEGFMFYQEDIINYNEVLIDTCQKLGIPVNDLYKFIMSGDPSRILLEDGIHFTEMGYELLGEQVADAIQLFLD